MRQVRHKIVCIASYVICVDLPLPFINHTTCDNPYSQSLCLSLVPFCAQLNYNKPQLLGVTNVCPVNKILPLVAGL